MGYRAELQQFPETVQDLALSAERRLEEAADLAMMDRPHSAIYLAGLAAEMYLKTACFYVDGALPGDAARPRLDAVANKSYKPTFKQHFESGHGLYFWSQELIARRTGSSKPIPPGLIPVAATLYDGWFVAMRYRPGSASFATAAIFINSVGWIAANHAALRS